MTNTLQHFPGCWTDAAHHTCAVERIRDLETRERSYRAALVVIEGCAQGVLDGATFLDRDAPADAVAGILDTDASYLEGGGK